MRKLLVFCLFICLATTCAWSELTLLDQTISAQEIPLGKAIRWELELHSDGPTKIDYQNIPDTLDKWEIFDRSLIKKSSGSGDSTLILELRRFEKGEFELPTLQLNYFDQTKKTQTLTIQGPKVELLGAPPKEEDKEGTLRPLKSELKAPFPYLILAFLVLAILELFYFFFKNRTQDAHLVAPLTPQEKALEQLLPLSPQKDYHQPKEWSDAISGILKTFLQEHYELPLAEKTHQDLLEFFQQMPSQHRELLAPYLRWQSLLDKARFGGATLSLEEAEKLYTEVNSWVKSPPSHLEFYHPTRNKKEHHAL